MKVGILALQGDFEAHGRVFRDLGCEVAFLRRPEELDTIDALVLPGGESTTMLNFLAEGGFLDRLCRCTAELPVYATCAGLILLAREVLSPAQESLDRLDVSVERNGWGRQVASFVGAIDAPLLAPAGSPPLEGVFIRAPRIRRLGEGVRVLGSCRGEPVLVRQDRILAASFHPELGNDDRIARYFLDEVAAPPAGDRR